MFVFLLLGDEPVFTIGALEWLDPALLHVLPGDVSLELVFDLGPERTLVALKLHLCRVDRGNVITHLFLESKPFVALGARERPLRLGQVERLVVLEVSPSLELASACGALVRGFGRVHVVFVGVQLLPCLELFVAQLAEGVVCCLHVDLHVFVVTAESDETHVAHFASVDCWVAHTVHVLVVLPQVGFPAEGLATCVAHVGLVTRM